MLRFWQTSDSRRYSINMKSRIVAAAAILCIVASAGSYPVEEGPSGHAVVMNSSVIELQVMDEAFVYCTASGTRPGDLLLYGVEWFDCHDVLVPRWTSQTQSVFSLGVGASLPHSYLVFHEFGNRSAGRYTCKVSFLGAVVSSASVTVREAPSASDGRPLGT